MDCLDNLTLLQNLKACGMLGKQILLQISGSLLHVRTIMLQISEISGSLCLNRLAANVWKFHVYLYNFEMNIWKPAICLNKVSKYYRIEASRFICRWGLSCLLYTVLIEISDMELNRHTVQHNSLNLNLSHPTFDCMLKSTSDLSADQNKFMCLVM